MSFPLGAFVGRCLSALFLMSHSLYGGQYDVGASDTEIRIGNTIPTTGPSVTSTSSVSYIRAAIAYIDKINLEEGGVNGRKVVIISKDDSFDPTKTVLLTKELIEKDRVLFMYLITGTPPNLAIKDYLNSRGIPHLFIIGSVNEFYDPINAPWTLSIYPKYQMETQLLAHYLLQNKPDAKIGVLYLNSDFGKSYLKAFKDSLGSKASKMIVKELPINATDMSVDFQILALKNSGADTFLIVSFGKQAILSMQQAYKSGWKPQLLLFTGASLRSPTLESVGFEKVKGAIATEIFKEPSDPRWNDDKGMQDYKAFMQKYYPSGDVNQMSNLKGYFAGQMLIALLKKAGDNLTRENIMRLAKNLKYSSTDFPVLLPGIDIRTTPSNYDMFSTMQLMQFDGQYWVPLTPFPEGK
jgi:branched-chain amino acid transport system substrate-binding protein